MKGDKESFCFDKSMSVYRSCCIHVSSNVVHRIFVFHSASLRLCVSLLFIKQILQSQSWRYGETRWNQRSTIQSQTRSTYQYQTFIRDLIRIDFIASSNILYTTFTLIDSSYVFPIRADTPLLIFTLYRANLPTTKAWPTFSLIFFQRFHYFFSFNLMRTCIESL